MTFGWILEDDVEAYYERTERKTDPGPPPAPTYCCPFCGGVYSSRRLLQDHVSDAHYVERPSLFIEGREPPNRTIIQRKLSSDRILITNATSAQFRLNGKAGDALAIADLPQYISRIGQGEFSLVLVNESQAKAAPVRTYYAIKFNIADHHELKDAELAYAEHVVRSDISRRTIDLFLADRRSQTAAREYATGLAEYSLGVLLKERPGAESLTTPFSRYREAYGAAYQRLSRFDRPLANLVCDIIRFAMNEFSTTGSKTGFWELDLANALLKNPEARALPLPPDVSIIRKPMCPIDHGTDQILNLAMRMIKQDRWSPILDNECRNVANADILDASDRQKAFAIWAAAAWQLGAHRSAAEPLRKIAGTYPFNTWAEPYLESIIT